MKKMIVLIGLLVANNAFADVVKMPMQDLLQTTDMDYVYEIKTDKFDKVVLDCQSFITGMSFSNQGVMKSNVYLDMFMCEEMVTFLHDSKENNLPVCIGLDSDASELYITRDEGDDCK